MTDEGSDNSGGSIRNAGINPFESDPEASAEAETEESEASTTEKTDNPGSESNAEPQTASETDTETDTATDNESTDSSTSQSQPINPQDFPYVFRRSGVTDERTAVTFYLQDSTTDKDDTIYESLEGTFDRNLDQTDVREAAFLVGLNHTDEIISVLEGWGYQQ